MTASQGKEEAVIDWVYSRQCRVEMRKWVRTIVSEDICRARIGTEEELQEILSISTVGKHGFLLDEAVQLETGLVSWMYDRKTGIGLSAE